MQIINPAAKLNKAMVHCRLRPRRPASLARLIHLVSAPRRLGHDATNARGVRHDAITTLAATMSTCLDMAHDLQIWRHPLNQKYTSCVSQRYEEHKATATCKKQKNIGEDRTCISRDMLADRQTHRHTNGHAYDNTPPAVQVSPSGIFHTL